MLQELETVVSSCGEPKHWQRTVWVGGYWWAPHASPDNDDDDDDDEYIMIDMNFNCFFNEMFSLF